MSGSEKDAAVREAAAMSAGLPVDQEGEPAFHEPWQAKAFAMAVELHRLGLYEWTEWAAALAQACKAQPPLGDAASPQDYARSYYSAWLQALEAVLSRKKVLTTSQVEETALIWKRAAEATPHGAPILFEMGLIDAKR